MAVRSAAAFLLLAVTSAAAQSTTPGGMPPPPGMSLAQSAAMRFPQPIRVGDLPGRPVIAPVESQDLLGRVRAVVRNGEGAILVVIELGRWFGWTTRTVAVPVEAMVLVGDALEVVTDTEAHLWMQPVFDGAGVTTLPAEATIRVGLAKPSH